MNALETTDASRTGAYPITARPFDLRRNPFFQPGTTSFDVRFMKSWWVVQPRRAVIELAADIFNLANHTNPLLLQRFQQQTTSQSGFASSGFPDQHDILRLGDELQLRKTADLFAIHARLAGEGKRLQRPALGQIRAPDTPLQRALLLGLKLRAHQALLMRTHEGRVWFSLNGRSGVEFKNNQGFYEFDLEIK